jgi:hypothetical protein
MVELLQGCGYDSKSIQDTKGPIGIVVEVTSTPFKNNRSDPYLNDNEEWNQPQLWIKQEFN